MSDFCVSENHLIVPCSVDSVVKRSLIGRWTGEFLEVPKPFKVEIKLPMLYLL